MGELVPRMRAGDADRAKTVERLGRHLAEGRLTVDEFDERVTRAHAARLNCLDPVTPPHDGAIHPWPGRSGPSRREPNVRRQV